MEFVNTMGGGNTKAGLSPGFHKSLDYLGNVYAVAVESEIG